jgi:translocation and assembly module TamB
MPASVPQLDYVKIDSSRPAPPPKAAPPAPPVVATLEIHFHDPGQTFVRGRGLTSEWRGDLDITGTSADPRIVGEFDNVNGTFDILGKSFVLEHGTLRFGGGPLPQLDILAQVQAADITAEILVQGSPTKPSLTLTSVPSLPQDEVLSRIMFGSGVGQITPAQGLQLAQAAATLAGGGPSMLDRLRNATGLDRLSVGSDPTQAGSGVTGTTISGGKYVAPGVFVGVDQGVSGTSTKAKVEVEITPHITANATAGAGSEGSSVGVQYKLDY